MSSADQGDEYTVTDLATLSGPNINTISTLVDIGDFVG